MALDDQVRAMLDWVATNPGPALGTAPIATIRAAYDASAEVVDPHPPDMAAVSDLAIDGPGGPIPARLFVPEGSLGSGLVVWCHGGGWLQGGLQSHDPTFRRLAAASGCRLVAVDYRLAPEHPFPAGLEDTLAALAWAKEHASSLGADPSLVVLGGDSAGANLALVASLEAGIMGDGPVLQVLCYPPLGPELLTDSLHEFATGYALTADEMAFCWQAYLPEGIDHADRRISPLLRQDLEVAPPTIIAVAGFDPLRDEGLAFAGLLEGAGVHVEVLAEDTLIHGFMRLGGIITAAKVAIEGIGHRLRTALDAIEHEDAEGHAS